MVNARPPEDARWFIRRLGEIARKWDRIPANPWIKKNVYEHRRDMLLESLRLRHWLAGGDYEEDPPSSDRTDSKDYDI